LGAWGYLEVVNEILKQLQQQNIPIDDVVVALGTNTHIHHSLIKLISIVYFRLISTVDILFEI
jgi:1-aminocyclopropane-1-carboxylate deaminase/D-cysteine desulfhydrase-like pyridoxal-dependent ACC family enzyme